jgi:hypothetical protein
MSIQSLPYILQKSARLAYYIFAQYTLYKLVLSRNPIAQDVPPPDLFRFPRARAAAAMAAG